MNAPAPGAGLRVVYRDNGFHPPRPVVAALALGWHGRCPACGDGGVRLGRTDAAPRCTACGEALHHGRIANLVPLAAGGAAFLVGAATAWAAIRLAGAGDLLAFAAAAVVATATATAAIPRVRGAATALAWSRYADGFDPLADPDADPSAVVLLAGRTVAAPRSVPDDDAPAPTDAVARPA